MSTPTGKCAWIDLTVDDASRIRDFYADVIGWTVENTPMGDYDDFTMKCSDGTAAAGVINKRGMNASLPPMWIPYFTVPDLAAAVTKVLANGGKILEYPSEKVVFFRDPAGAVAAMVEAQRTPTP